jgi:type VI secretion system protein ImpC
MEGTMTISKDTEAMINARIAQIDKLISDQLNEVMHHEDSRNWKAPGGGCTIW